MFDNLGEVGAAPRVYVLGPHTLVMIQTTKCCNVINPLQPFNSESGKEEFIETW